MRIVGRRCISCTCIKFAITSAKNSICQSSSWAVYVRSLQKIQLTEPRYTNTVHNLVTEISVHPDMPVRQVALFPLPPLQEFRLNYKQAIWQVPWRELIAVYIQRLDFYAIKKFWFCLVTTSWWSLVPPTFIAPMQVLQIPPIEVNRPYQPLLTSIIAMNRIKSCQAISFDSSWQAKHGSEGFPLLIQGIVVTS